MQDIVHGTTTTASETNHTYLEDFVVAVLSLHIRCCQRTQCHRCGPKGCLFDKITALQIERAIIRFRVSFGVVFIILIHGHDVVIVGRGS